MKKEVIGLLVILIISVPGFVSAQENVTSNETDDEVVCPEFPASKFCSDGETLCPQTTDEEGCPAWDCELCEFESECEDSDGGREYYVKGSLRMSCAPAGPCPTLCTSAPSSGESPTCVSPSDWCSDDSILNEGYCENGEIVFEKYTCAEVCENGECIKKEEPPEPRGDGKGKGGQEPGEPPYEVETCAESIKVTLNKDVYYYGDSFKLAIEVFDKEGNSLSNYPFRIQMYDTKSHTPESHMTNENGQFVVEGIIEKDKQRPGKVQITLSTAPNIKACGPVRDSIEVEIKEGQETEEICGIGVCVPDEKKVKEIPKDEVLYACSGCELESKCYPMGYRKSGKYCSENYEFIGQLDEGGCENSFECKSNLCVSGECVGEGFLRRIMNWFKKMFGGGEEDEEEERVETCSELLIEEDIGEYAYEESGYGDSKESQAPLYAENGERLGSLRCCRAQYSYGGEHGGQAIICPYDSRGDVENALKWLLSRGEISSGGYRDEEVYRVGEPVIVWAHKQLLVAVGGGEGPEPELNVPLPEDVADAYLEEYKNDLGEIPEGDAPYDPKPLVFCTDEDKRQAKECMNGGGYMKSDPSAFDGSEEGKKSCTESKGYGEGCCEVYTGCTPSEGPTKGHESAKEFLIKAELLGEVTLIDFETLPDGTVLQRSERLTGGEWESSGVVFEAPSEDFLKVFGPWPPFNPIDKLSLSPGHGPFEAGGDTYDDLNIIFSEPVKAAGIYLLDLGETDERESITFLDENGGVIEKISPWPKSTFGNPAPGTFVSLVHDGISKIEILENSQDGDDIAYDNLYFVK